MQPFFNRLLCAASLAAILGLNLPARLVRREWGDGGFVAGNGGRARPLRVHQLGGRYFSAGRG